MSCPKRLKFTPYEKFLKKFKYKNALMAALQVLVVLVLVRVCVRVCACEALSQGRTSTILP